MSPAALVSLVGQGVRPTIEKTDRACTINGTRTRHRMNGEAVCQGCIRRAQAANQVAERAAALVPPAASVIAALDAAMAPRLPEPAPYPQPAPVEGPRGAFAGLTPSQRAYLETLDREYEARVWGKGGAA